MYIVIVLTLVCILRNICDIHSILVLFCKDFRLLIGIYEIDFSIHIIDLINSLIFRIYHRLLVLVLFLLNLVPYRTGLALIGHRWFMTLTCFFPIFEYMSLILLSHLD